jgi:hypothetical protein
LFADPGLPVPGTTTPGWQLALASADAGSNGWGAFLAGIGLPSALAPAVVAVLLAPLAVIALLALFLPGSPRTIPALVIALLGFVTALVGTHVEVTIIGSTTTPIWAGTGLSLYWLGLIGALIVALEALGRRAAVPAALAGIGVVLVAIPLFAAAAGATIPVIESNGRLLPAFVSAEAVTNPTLGTLELAPQSDGGVAVTLHRGPGTTLDEQSTLNATDTSTSKADGRLAILAGNIASRSGFDIAGELDALQIAFVLVPHTADDSVAATHQRVTDALDGNRILSPVGDTVNGYLWHYTAFAPGKAPSGPGPTETNLGIGILVGQGIVFGLTLLLAIPTTRRRRLRSARVTGDERDDDAGDFELVEPGDADA